MRALASKEPLRCLHIVSGDLWAGAEASVLELAAEQARGASVRPGALVLNAGALESKLRAAGVTTWVVAESGRSFPALVREAVRVAREFEPDVLHSHRFKEHLLGAALAAASGAAQVRTAHGLSPALGWKRKPLGLGALLDDAVADLGGSHWIAVSDELARHVGGLRRRVHVVTNGMAPAAPPADRAALERAVGAADEPVAIVGFVGRLEEVKRPDRFLRVLAALPERVAGKRVVGAVVGDGTQAAALRGQASSLRLYDRVAFLGHRPDGAALVAALDVLVLCSDHEGLPMVLLEAMRAGVPVVATAVGGIPEAAGASEWIVPAHDEGALAQALVRLLEDPEARARWSARLAQRFRERFTIAMTAERVRQVYAQALANGAA